MKPNIKEEVVLANSKKILIVNDESITSQPLPKILNRLNYKRFSVADKISVIEKITSENPDLILLDLRMPGLSGIDALRKIKELNKNIPIIVVSGFLKKLSIRKADKFGQLQCMEEPFNVNRLKDKIQKALIIDLDLQ